MNKQRRKQLEEASTFLAVAKDLIEGVAAEEDTARENLPDSLQEGEQGDHMSEVIELLEAAVSTIEDVDANLEEARE